MIRLPRNIAASAGDTKAMEALRLQRHAQIVFSLGTWARVTRRQTIQTVSTCQLLPL